MRLAAAAIWGCLINSGFDMSTTHVMENLLISYGGNLQAHFASVSPVELVKNQFQNSEIQKHKF